MAVPSVMTDLSTTAGSNSPAGSESIGTNLDDYLRAIQAIIRTTNAKGSDIASATTTNIGAATGEFVDVTGTTTITSFGTVAAGIVRTVRFTGALTLTHNATSLILPGGASITTANGDVGIFRSLGSGNWVCISYVPAAWFLRLATGGTVAGATHFSAALTSSLDATTTAGVAVQRNLPRTSGKQAILSNFTASRASVSTITVAADGVYLVDSNGTSKYFTGLSETLNIAASGANGLDTGAEASSTWYHLWAIGKTDNTLDGLISASSTAPTMPSGYTFKGYLGAVRNDGASDFIDFNQVGDYVEYGAIQTVINGSVTSGAWTSQSVTSFFPPTAAKVKITLAAGNAFGISANSSGQGGEYFNFGSTGNETFGIFPTTRASHATMTIRYAATLYYWFSTTTASFMAIGWEF